MPDTGRLAIGSVLVGVVVLIFKALAWWMTGSVALYSDALESTVNVVTAIAALIAIRVAARPPDAVHPYGHAKAEYFSAVLGGVMIIVAALLVLAEAYRAVTSPAPLELPIVGLAVSGVATAINFGWARMLSQRGRRARSPALMAEARHLYADIVTTAGVALGVVLAVVTGWTILDPLVAALVAAHILWTGSKVVRSSLSGLMDEAVAPETLATVQRIIATEAGGALQAHDLRTRQSGPVTFIDFHLVMPDNTTVFDAHEVCDRVEAALTDAVGGARITIHVEPEHKQKRSGIDIPG
ncbi:cation diffusion facilitator family transporter [Roseobacter sp. HKCCA0434]|uniref:cation diffusion facilitator family transporter n=1 Tax=Roseobacter sp. HKCCA0434 TaxID=3079297 RepID=UPI002905CEA1|nr:cation diffusion facilitator family transporter [Roseobacter sp. HKCCA0434]